MIIVVPLLVLIYSIFKGMVERRRGRECFHLYMIRGQQISEGLICFTWKHYDTPPPCLCPWRFMILSCTGKNLKGLGYALKKYLHPNMRNIMFTEGLPGNNLCLNNLKIWYYDFIAFHLACPADVCFGDSITCFSCCCIFILTCLVQTVM